MQLVCVCIYTTQRDYTVRCKSHLTTKNHTGRGRRGDSEAVRWFQRVCPCVCIRPLSNSSCKKLVWSDYRAEWVEFATQDKLMNVQKEHAFVILMQQTPPTRSNNKIETNTKISLQSQSEAGLEFGKSRIVGATERHCPISHFIGAITVVPA